MWNEPSEFHESFSSSSSESSPTYPPWDPDSMTPLKVKVRTGKKFDKISYLFLSSLSPIVSMCVNSFFYSTRFYSDPRLIYPMSCSPRGLALIINNIEFTTPELFPFRCRPISDSYYLIYVMLGMEHIAKFTRLLDFFGEKTALCVHHTYCVSITLPNT